MGCHGHRGTEVFGYDGGCVVSEYLGNRKARARRATRHSAAYTMNECRAGSHTRELVVGCSRPNVHLGVRPPAP